MTSDLHASALRAAGIVGRTDRTKRRKWARKLPIKWSLECLKKVEMKSGSLSLERRLAVSDEALDFFLMTDRFGGEVGCFAGLAGAAAAADREMIEKEEEEEEEDGEDEEDEEYAEEDNDEDGWPNIARIMPGCFLSFKQSGK